MSMSRWTWKAALAAAAVVAAAAVLAPATARSDDDEELEISADVAALQDALANWDDDVQREKGLALYLGAESRDALFAAVEDPAQPHND
jgi:hypothetical protein